MKWVYTVGWVGQLDVDYVDWIVLFVEGVSQTALAFPNTDDLSNESKHCISSVHFCLHSSFSLHKLIQTTNVPQPHFLNAYVVYNNKKMVYLLNNSK